MFPVNLNRYEESIRQLEAYPVETGKVMLYGSSFFAKWHYDRARQQLRDATGGALEIVNHGFGGATADELLYYYPRLVTPYAPKVVVIRSIYNDLHKGLNPEQTILLLERLIVWLKHDDPERVVISLQVNDNKRVDDARMEELRHCNHLMNAMLAQYPGVYSLDINEFFYSDAADIGDRSKLRDVFVEDNIHLTDEAYLEMADYLGKKIMDILHLHEKNC